MREEAKRRPAPYLIEDWPADLETGAMTAALDALHRMRLAPSSEEIDVFAATRQRELAPGGGGIIGNLGRPKRSLRQPSTGKIT